ncbi:MAG TPA: response regulator, partial [Saprospiraceae bacterium]|nr:response regulator [Saprospiraceae bacterium]
MRILIIEDEKKTAAYLKKGLTENAFTVDVAEEGETGLFLATTGDYDLIILDLMLPKRDGWSILKTLRASDHDTRTLVLTARDAVADRVRGLELGADD